MKLLLIITALAFQSVAMASGNHGQFMNYLKSTAGIVPVNLTSQVAYNYSQSIYEIDESLFEQLLSVAQSQSEIWGDTILEGDVWSLGEIRLDDIELLQDGNEVLGYHISYSQKGWDTSGCDLSRATSEDYEREETFAQCAEGRVVESAYVTSDLNTYFADHGALARLERNVE